MMAFINEHSCECLSSELDIFSLPPTLTSMETSDYVEYHPITSITAGAPIEFDITGNGQDYIDLSNSLLYVRAKVTNAQGADLAADAAVGPINLLLHSMFSQIDISLNGTLISSSTNTYAYRSIIETLLSFGEDAKKSQLTSEMFYKDTARKMNSVTFGDANENNGLKLRREVIAQSREFDMMGRIHADMFFQNRYLLNEVGIKLKLVRNKDVFCLMGDGAKLDVVHASLFVRKVKLSSAVFLSHAKALENATAKYPIKRVVCKAFAIPRHYLDASHEKLFSGQLPTRVVIGLVDNRAFNGSATRNPFNFEHFNLSEISLYLDGQMQYGLKPIQPDYNQGLYIRAFN